MTNHLFWLLLTPLGFSAWCLTEYSAHRFAMHATGGRGIAAKEHLMHHAQPTRTRFLIRTLGHLGMYSGAVVMAFVLQFFMPWLAACALAGGWALGYTHYELVHWLAHHRPPRSAWDLRLRRRHFHHHFAAPTTNLGVAFAFLDQLLGTNVVPELIKVPRRLAPSWLVDTDGAVLPEYAANWIIVGQLVASPDQDARDLTDAFANRAPAPQ